MKDKIYSIIQTALHDDIGQRQINDVFAYRTSVLFCLFLAKYRCSCDAEHGVGVGGESPL